MIVLLIFWHAQRRIMIRIMSKSMNVTGFIAPSKLHLLI